MWKTITGEIKKIFIHKFFIVAIAAVTVVPMLYSYLYLDAFWDPYSRLEKLPVAVVNQDLGDENHKGVETVGAKFVDRLKDNKDVKWVFTSEKKALSGLDSDKYYAAFIIPEEFTKSTFSGAKNNPAKVNLIYCNNEKKNFLAAQVNSKVVRELQDNIQASISKEYTKAAFDALYSAKDGMITAKDGGKAISRGADKLSKAVPQIDKASEKFKISATQLRQGSARINQGVSAAQGAIMNSGNSLKSIGENLKAAIGKNPALATDPNIQGIIGELRSQEVSGAKTKAAIMQLGQGLTDYSRGAVQFAQGTEEFSKKVQILAPNLKKLSVGADHMATGLAQGSDKLAAELSTDSQTVANFVSDPVKLEEKRIHRVDNYGTGFAPYFIPLSLWVGAIMMFFVISPFFKKEDKKSKLTQVIGKYCAYGFVGLLQGILVSLAVLHLGLEPMQKIRMIGFILLMSLVFVAIMQCLITLLGDAGRIMAIILLILQLTSCGGTFPLELVPNFFRTLNPFMPFTYAVEALRELVSGDNMSVVTKDVLILLAIGAIAIALTTIFVEQGRKITEKMERRKLEAQNA